MRVSWGAAYFNTSPASTTGSEEATDCAASKLCEIPTAGTCGDATTSSEPTAGSTSAVASTAGSLELCWKSA